MIVLTTQRHKRHELNPCMTPDVRAALPAAWAAVKAFDPGIDGYLGHDGSRMYFQKHGDPTPYSVEFAR